MCYSLWYNAPTILPAGHRPVGNIRVNLNIFLPSTHRLPKLHIMSLFPRVFLYATAMCVKDTFYLDLISSDVVIVLIVLEHPVYPPLIVCILSLYIPLKLK